MCQEKKLEASESFFFVAIFAIFARSEELENFIMEMLRASFNDKTFIQAQIKKHMSRI